jgi:hypothetical protein
MSVSISELDNTVRAFYEGKGDVVSSQHRREILAAADPGIYQLAKASAANSHRGREPCRPVPFAPPLTRPAID